MKHNVVEFDVAVIGAGAAGIAAAVGAARTGARVCLVERYGFLGGAATASSVLTHCGFFDQNRRQVVAGVGQTVLDKLAAQDLYRVHTVAATGNTVVLLDLETMKRVYDEVVLEAGVRLFLHSYLTGAETSADGRIEAVHLAHRGGTRRITATSFVDASGDGALISAAGAEQLLAAPGERQASTLVMRVGGVPGEGPEIDAELMARAVERYQQEHDVSLPRSGGITVRMPVAGDLMMLLADQHVDVLDVEALTAAEIEARAHAWHYVRAFRNYVPGWEDAYLLTTGPQIGIRETRRLAGHDVVTAADVASGRKRPEDVVARGGWPMEEHVARGRTEYTRVADGGWYDVPYGAITSASTENLWAAGRLTSSDSSAFASLRVMGTSFATGHAAGVAAAVAADRGRHDLDQVRGILAEQGAML